MAENELDTDSVDEAEALIQQLLDAGMVERLQNTPQLGDETVDEDVEDDSEEGDGGDNSEDDGDDADDETVDEGITEEPVTPAVTTPAAAETPGPFDSLTSEEKAALLKVRALLTDNPDIAEKFDQAVAAKFNPQPDLSLPPEIDPEDTTSVKLWERIQEVRADAQATSARQEAEARTTGQRQVQNDIHAAVDRFKVAHPNLSDEDIGHIRAHTSSNVNIASVMSNFPGDPVEGIVRSMEIGSMTDPATRDKVLGVDTKAVAAKAETTRKKNLSALSGSTGSGPRTKPQTKKPGNWQEMTKQLTKELEELGGL